jgi:sterol desaturase/sphingolipid hydroxylase (fatty acid hydroxylase superfamily)
MNLPEALVQLQQDQLIVYALPIFFLAMLAEFSLGRRARRQLYSGKDFLTSMAIGLVSLVVEFLPKLLAFVAYWHLHEWSPLKDFVGRQWWAWLLLFLLDDLTYYWFHRLNHQVRLLWAGHVSHHSSEFLNLGTALRQGVGERLHKFFFWAPLALLGFDPLMIFMMISISLFYQFWVHTELIDRLPAWFEVIMNTPSHHRVHHASNVPYLDCNHAGVLIIWDRLFGTFSAETSEQPPIYGLTTNIETFNVVSVAFHEYAALWRDVCRAKSWTDKLKYVFWAPGWSHDGQDKRARVQRQQLHSRVSDKTD